MVDNTRRKRNFQETLYVFIVINEGEFDELIQWGSLTTLQSESGPKQKPLNWNPIDSTMSVCCVYSSVCFLYFRLVHIIFVGIHRHFLFWRLWLYCYCFRLAASHSLTVIRCFFSVLFLFISSILLTFFDSGAVAAVWYCCCLVKRSSFHPR